MHYLFLHCPLQTEQKGRKSWVTFILTHHGFVQQCLQASWLIWTDACSPRSLLRGEIKFPINKKKTWILTEVSSERAHPVKLSFFHQLGGIGSIKYHQHHQCSILEGPVTNSVLRNFLHDIRSMSPHVHAAVSAHAPLCMLPRRLPQRSSAWCWAP